MGFRSLFMTLTEQLCDIQVLLLEKHLHAIAMLALSSLDGAVWTQTHQSGKVCLDRFNQLSPMG